MSEADNEKRRRAFTDTAVIAHALGKGLIPGCSHGGSFRTELRRFAVSRPVFSRQGFRRYKLKN
jgi:hypothetical protein